MSAEGAGDHGVTRRGFVAAAAGTVAGGGGLLAPSLARAAPVGIRASVVIQRVGYNFSAVTISPVGGHPPSSWHILLTTQDSGAQAQVETLYQTFLASARTLSGSHLLKGELVTYRANGAVRARFAFRDAFPAGVLLAEHAALAGQIPLQAQLQLVARKLRRVS